MLKRMYFFGPISIGVIVFQQNKPLFFLVRWPLNTAWNVKLLCCYVWVLDSD